MTTVEVVEAVQRTLENEGVLQTVRAQLRANVLRIISSGPDYVPKSGKLVSFVGTEQGLLVMYLVRDLLNVLNMKESLSVFDAESGLETQTRVERMNLADKLQINDTDPHISILQQLVIMHLSRGSFKSDVDAKSDGKSADYALESKAEKGIEKPEDDAYDEIQNWPDEAKNDQITAHPQCDEKNNILAGDTMHAVGDSDFEEEDDDLQEFSQVDADVEAENKKLSNYLGKTAIAHGEESSSFEHSNTGEFKSMIESRDAYDAPQAKDSNDIKLDVDDKSSEKMVETGRQGDFIDSKKGSNDGGSSSDNDFVQIDEEDALSVDQSHGVEHENKENDLFAGDDHQNEKVNITTVGTTTAEPVNDVSKTSGGRTDDVESEGVPEYNSEDESTTGQQSDDEWDKKNREYNSDIIDATSVSNEKVKHVAVAGVDEKEESLGAGDGTASLSSAGSARANITRLSQNATSRAQRGWAADDTVDGHEDLFNQDDMPSLDLKSRRTGYLRSRVESKIDERTNMKVDDFEVDNDEFEGSAEVDHLNESRNQLEDRDVDNPDSEDDGNHDSSFDDEHDDDVPRKNIISRNAFESPEKAVEEDDYGEDDFDDDFEEDADSADNDDKHLVQKTNVDIVSHPYEAKIDLENEDADEVLSVEEEDISVGQDSDESEIYGGNDGKNKNDVDNNPTLFQTRSGTFPESAPATQPTRRTNFDSILNDESDDSMNADDDFQYEQNTPIGNINEKNVSGSDDQGEGNLADSRLKKDDESLASENLDEFSTGGDHNDSEDDSF